MANSKTQQPLGNIDVKWGDLHMGKVILTSAAPKIAEKYDLTPAMVKEMAECVVGYPIADMRVVKALAKRGIMKLMDKNEPDGGYEFTALGDRLCSQMFAVMGKRY